MPSPLLMIHIIGAVIGLLSGYLAMVFRKGSGLHQVTGSIFFISMISMTVSAAIVATFERPIAINVVAGMLTFYLVMTSWWTARHREGGTGMVERAALLFVSVVAIGGLSFGLEAIGNPTRSLDSVPAAAYFIFGTVALLHAVSDVRLLMRGGVTGGRRIARHLSRMCLALMIATLSLYPGQARLFPMSWRQSKLLFVPHILLLGAMLFWLYRMRTRRPVAQSRSEVNEVMAAA